MICRTLTQTYIPSFSARTIVYKGLLLANQVGTFYDDLRDRGLRLRAGPRPSAIQHQHLPQLAAGPPVPLHGA